MSWNLLAYAVPLNGVFGSSERLMSWASHSYESIAGSRHAPLVQEIAERIFTAEHQPGAPYYHRIEEMLESLPECEEKSMKNLAKKRVRTLIDNTHLISSATNYPKCYIFLPESYRSDKVPDKEIVEALPWLVSREISYFLGKEEQCAQRWSAVASFIVAFVTTSFLGWGLLASFAVTFLSALVPYGIHKTNVEHRADAFANKHCTVEERKKALAALQRLHDKIRFQEKSRLLAELDYPSRRKSLRASLRLA